MSSPRRLLLKPVALLLVFAVLQVYVLVNPAKASAATNNTSTNAPASMLFGQLLMSGEQSALINGTKATSGTTIFSGAQLQTPAGVAATVQLGTLGRLAIDPDTLLSLTFDKDYIDVQVTAGNAVLTTNAGVKGTLATPNGEKLSTNAATTSTVGSGAARRRAGGNALGFILTAALVTVAIIAVVVDDDNNDNISP